MIGLYSAKSLSDQALLATVLMRTITASANLSMSTLGWNEYSVTWTAANPAWRSFPQTTSGSFYLDGNVSRGLGKGNGSSVTISGHQPMDLQDVKPAIPSGSKRRRVSWSTYVFVPGRKEYPK